MLQKNNDELWEEFDCLHDKKEGIEKEILKTKKIYFSFLFIYFMAIVAITLLFDSVMKIALTLIVLSVFLIFNRFSSRKILVLGEKKVETQIEMFEYLEKLK